MKDEPMNLPSCHSREHPSPGFDRSPLLRPREDAMTSLTGTHGGSLRRDIRLPSPPAVAMRILEAVRNENLSTDELVKIISSDPALALKVLRIANSPLYTRSEKVATVKSAIRILGVNALKNVALSFVIMDGITAGSKTSCDFESLWRRSITAAVSCEIISKHMRTNQDDLFISALLQDIGTVILSLHLPGPGAEPYWIEPHAPASLAEEKAIYGFDHQEIGYEILRQWGLPETVCDLVGNHHNGENAPRALQPKLRVLTLANTLSSLFYSSGSHKDLEDFCHNLESLCRTTSGEMEMLINLAHERTREILSYFDIGPGSMKTCSQILQEANEELGRLNLTYEQMVVELRRAKEKAENLAVRLTEANARLRELTYRDPLTGLFNHGHFQELLERELTRASRYGHPLSLILFDLDHFKEVNDRYGHPVGDGVLRRIGELVTGNVRTCDYVARYGGEEFGIILPETDAKGSSILAERIRMAIEDAEIRVSESRIRATVSVGVATVHPLKAVKSKSQIIAAADRALYEAKRQGRNRTCRAQF